ncbi:MAG: hypothetical protein LBB65_05250 [Burkholderiales bacterium]|jgi:hypothetical protein|nr:hypothetical protein [Burkholderiales bacterium]
MKTKKFALAGEIVSTEKRAREIWRWAIRYNKFWLIPQALSVAHQLAANKAKNPSPLVGEGKGKMCAANTL